MIGGAADFSAKTPKTLSKKTKANASKIPMAKFIPMPPLRFMEETETAETIPADDDKEEMGMPEMMKKMEDMAYRIDEMEKKISKMAEVEIEVKEDDENIHGYAGMHDVQPVLKKQHNHDPKDILKNHYFDSGD